MLFICFLFSYQAANKKLQQLEEKIRVKNTDNKEHVEEAAVPIPLPEWEKERELRDKERERESRDKDRSRTSSEGRDEKTVRDTRDVGSDFRQLTQVFRVLTLTRICCCCDSVGKRVRKSIERESAPFCML